MPLFVDAIASMRKRAVPKPVNDWPAYVPRLGGSIEMVDGSYASYRDIYRSQPWVWSAVLAISRGMMRMPIKVYEGDGDERARVTTGDLVRLTERTPAAGWSPSRHREAIAKTVAIYGNAIVVKLGMDSEGDTPTERMIAPPVGWSVAADDTYIWTNPKDGQRYPFPRWQIEHYRFWDVDTNGFGISPLEPLRRTLADDDGARRYSNAAFRNGSRPLNVLKTDQEMTTEGVAKLKAEWQAIHGGVDNAFKLAVLQKGLDYAVVSYDLEKAAVVPHRELTPVEVAAVYGLQPSMLGWAKEANFASIEMFHTMHYQDSLGAWAVMFEDTLQTDLVLPTTAFDGQTVEIDMNAVMRGDLPTRVRAYATQITTGQKSPNEIRRLENDPPSKQEGADMLLFPLNLAGAVGAQTAEDTGQEDRTDAS